MTLQTRLFLTKQSRGFSFSLQVWIIRLQQGLAAVSGGTEQMIESLQREHKPRGELHRLKARRT